MFFIDEDTGQPIRKGVHPDQVDPTSGIVVSNPEPQSMGTGPRRPSVFDAALEQWP